MKIVENNLSSSESADLKKQKDKLKKKAISDSIVVFVLTFFGLMLVLLICEKFGLIKSLVYSKPVLIGISFLSATLYYLQRLDKLKAKDRSIKRVIQYIFTITD